MGKKFINPVEKARKQAKKKEINKQKKQRLEARSLNLKGKDPNLILQELERLDKIQYSIEEPPKLNEKVIESKRRKLKETMIKILSVYKKEDESKYTQIRRLEMEYDAKRVQLIKKFEAVNSAKQVNLEEIPLPFNSDDQPSSSSVSTTNYDNIKNLSKSNLREPQTEYLTIDDELRNDLKPPGCPSCIPPTIDELEEDIKLINESKNAEKDLDEFLKEVEQVEKMVSEQTKDVTAATNLVKSTLPPPSINIPPPPLPPMLAAALPPIKATTSLKPNSINPPFPVLLNPMGLLGHPHLANKSNMHVRPPHHSSNKFNPSSMTSRQHQQQTRKDQLEKVSTSTTIEAKPQLRNLSADVTKFLPTSLRIKRQETKKPVKSNEPQGIQSYRQLTTQVINNSNRQPVNNQANKDVAYEEFMKELNGLI